MLPDIERYRHHLNAIDLTEDQKTELVRALWSLLESFVDQSFSGNPAPLNFDADIGTEATLESSRPRIPSDFSGSETNHLNRERH